MAIHPIPEAHTNMEKEVAPSSPSSSTSTLHNRPQPTVPDLESAPLPEDAFTAFAEAEEKGPQPTPPASQLQQTASAFPIPEGGLQAWLQVLGSWAILVATWGLVNTFGVFQTYYETDLLAGKSNGSAISWIGSLQASLLLIAGLISGPLYDAGYFRATIATGLGLVVLGLFMTSLATEYWHLILAQGLCIGLGMGLTFLPSTAILSQYFLRRRALVIGIASTGSPLAGIVFPIIFSRLEPSVGFGWATRVIAFIVLAFSAVPVAFMRTRVPTSGRKRALFDSTALRDGSFTVFAFGGFASFLVLYVPFFYTQLYTVAKGIAEPGFAPYLVTFLNVGSVFGRVVPNALADRYGALNVMSVCTLASAVLAFGWMGTKDLGGLTVFALLYGLFSGALVSLTPSVLVGLSPDMSRVGARMGMSFCVVGLAILVGTPIAGAILGDGQGGAWLDVMGYTAAFLSVATVLYAVSRFLLYRKKGGLVA